MPSDLICPECGSDRIHRGCGIYLCRDCGYKSSAQYHFEGGGDVSKKKLSKKKLVEKEEIPPEKEGSFIGEGIDLSSIGTTEVEATVTVPTPPQLKCPKCGSTDINVFEGNYKCRKCGHHSAARYHFATS